MRASTSLAVLSLVSFSFAAPAPAPVAVSIPEITPAPTAQEIATTTIEERQLLPNLVGGVLGGVVGLRVGEDLVQSSECRVDEREQPFLGLGLDLR